MPQTFSAADAVELAVIERSGFVESRHVGSAIVIDADGQIATQLGDTSTPILPRSSLKPLQALACLTAGAPLEGVQLGLATASHSGTDRHASAVRDILDAAGLDEHALACPAAWPLDSGTRDDLIRAGEKPSPVRMNCSGKHAAMLLACVVNGWDPASYLEFEHPLQVHIREVTERLIGQKITSTAVDGCGAPVHAMSLMGLARAIHRIGGASERSPFALHRQAATLVRAVRENPWTIAGPGRDDTVMIERLGVFAKVGAEGVMVMSAPNGTTVALKILDGSTRAAALVAVRLLERAGALAASEVDDAVTALPLAVTGGGRDVGVIRSAF
ncbi:asparaginase [Microbacterium sp. BWT-B31]|uniref:asparaginase n=1 Tax=Microbacterium sp. BWT-B31 TaxID=3232072 RepID=UPI0035271AC7